LTGGFVTETAAYASLNAQEKGRIMDQSAALGPDFREVDGSSNQFIGSFALHLLLRFM
jgi:hypothetical protein